MPFKLPRIYPITDTGLSGLSHAEQVSRLIAGGATLVQLRDKHAAPNNFYRSAAAALQIAHDHDVKIIINDRVDLALALKADGVHLGQTDLHPAAARELLGPAAIIGVSTHNLVQMELAIREPVDYVAFGPIFDTATKEAPDPGVGVNVLQRARALTPLPMVAIGGITRANAHLLFRAGADAVATIAGLLAGPDSISENFRQMLKTAG